MRGDPEQTYQSPLDWRLLDYHAYSRLDQLARLLIERDLPGEAQEYVQASRRRPGMRPAHLLARMCLLAGRHQVERVTSLVEDLTWMKGPGPDGLGTLLIAHYLLLERWSLRREIDRAFAIWLRERQIHRLPPGLWLPLLRGEQVVKWSDRHSLPSVPASLRGHDAEMENRVEQWVRTAHYDELADFLMEMTRRRDKGVAISLVLSYTFRHCGEDHLHRAACLADEFLPACAPGRRVQVLNDSCAAHVRLGLRQGYADCFRRAAAWRKAGLISRSASLSPILFDRLRSRGIVWGNMIWSFGLT
jgi:hypothetical protein